jgi:hypothetical protein
MVSTAHIIVQDEHKVYDDWRRFVAILCFIYFFTKFVGSGSSLWGRYHILHKSIQFDYTLLEGFIGILSSIVLYLCGRSLWYKGRFILWWLIGAIIALLSATCIDYFHE